MSDTIKPIKKKFTEITEIKPARRKRTSPASRINTLARFRDDFTTVQSTIEAQRCFHCRANKGLPPCATECPLERDIAVMFQNYQRGDFRTAAQAMDAGVGLLALTGDYCPEDLCKKGKHVGSGESKKGAGCIYSGPNYDADSKHPIDIVAISEVEKHLGMMALQHGWNFGTPSPRNGKYVAVVGSGAAGLAAAESFNRKGYWVMVFERDRVFGGVIIYGIPPFRRDTPAVAMTVERMEENGVIFQSGVTVGKGPTIPDLIEGNVALPNGMKLPPFSAVVIAVGAGPTRSLGVEGEYNTIGVQSANRYLMNICNGGDVMLPAEFIVCVIGAGDTAIDAIRTALRLSKIYAELYGDAINMRTVVVYYRDEEDMMADANEIADAKEESIEFLFRHRLAEPSPFVVNDKNVLQEIVLEEMEVLDEKGSNGKHKIASYSPPKTMTKPCHLCLNATGTTLNTSIIRDTPGLSVDKDTGFLKRMGPDSYKVDTGEYDLPIYAAGDINGAGLVVTAIKEGRDLVEEAHQELI
jgi:NADPH-dependent glutamate synthase beta subunit-like oxidoreductase